ncbi:WD repeat-containing protein 18-like [Ctenocephalides felis]|uniref:WD repeat-containing protein 18-like n=1 Tax=Ctenocephalides felis TaxID=7515 RepID=UPI000E6E1025|nr:WD repeat-containing protein 18-like [Ctenocephalides felis]
MNNLLEVVFVSDDSGQNNTSVYDPNTCTMVMSYKGGNLASPRTVSLINHNYLIAADRVKPLLNVWPINSQETVQGLRMICPGRVGALDVTPKGIYLAAGIEDKLHIWHASTGRLASVISRHYQPISCVKFTDDGSFLITAGQDGVILVWNFAYLIQVVGANERTQEPLYSFSDHTLPVTDIFVGRGGLNTQLISVSKDRTCRIYDLTRGVLLNSVIFKNALTSVTMDFLEQSVFVGDAEGKIYQFFLCSAPNVVEGESTDMCFTGHESTVSCLSTSADGQTLMSGGQDSKVIFWHIPSRKMIRKIMLKGAVSNAFFAPAPSNMFSNEFKPQPIGSLAKTLNLSEESPFIIEVLNTNRSMFNSNELLLNSGNTESGVSNYQEKQEMERLEYVNKDLFQEAMKAILTKEKC